MSHITHYDQMPIPPVEAQTEYFEAGALRFGVEYRLLNDAIAAAHSGGEAPHSNDGAGFGDDRGVSIHVFLRDGERWLEHLRFDCFDEDPHYHYVCWRTRSNEMLHIDPIAAGDPLAWALDCLRTRLPQMLERAGAQDPGARIEAAAVDAVLPRVSEAAYRLRFHYDDAATLAAALVAAR